MESKNEARLWLKRAVFISAFILLVFFGNKINFSKLIGAENQFFTLFQFFGPIAGSFLGPLYGAVAVLGSQLIDFFAAGKAFSLINLVRLLPMVFAAYYFGVKKRRSLTVVVPLLAILAFVLHPVGGEVWFFSLFWTIPVIIKVLPIRFSNNTFLRSLGATFTAHAVGGAAWVWSVPMTAGQWVSLIPVVIYERALFAVGITVSYFVFNALLDILAEKFRWNSPDKVLFTRSPSFFKKFVSWFSVKN
ncbi:hypothetical protein HYV84_03015 [Candidatus Woesearchaeota archaeon]|nr:hypothetical protein [Candidatus Woesearchaeota archaeon]